MINMDMINNPDEFFDNFSKSSAQLASFVATLQSWNDDNAKRSAIFAALMILKIKFPEQFEFALVDFLRR